MLFIALAGCGVVEPNYEAEGRKLRIANDEAPPEVRTPIAKVLHHCRISGSEVLIFHNLHAWVKQEWIIELPRTKATSPSVTECIENEVASLGLSSKLTWGELPPPPPPASEMDEAYLLLAAERHVDEPANLPPIPNAREILPNVLQRCGINAFREEEISDGIVAIRFTFKRKETSDRLSCVQREQPHGAWVEEAVL